MNSFLRRPQQGAPSLDMTRGMKEGGVIGRGEGGGSGLGQVEPNLISLRDEREIETCLINNEIVVSVRMSNPATVLTNGCLASGPAQDQTCFNKK
jgi:hypothetical protein